MMNIVVWISRILHIVSLRTNDTPLNFLLSQGGFSLLKLSKIRCYKLSELIIGFLLSYILCNFVHMVHRFWHFRSLFRIPFTFLFFSLASLLVSFLQNSILTDLINNECHRWKHVLIKTPPCSDSAYFN